MIEEKEARHELAHVVLVHEASHARPGKRELGRSEPRRREIAVRSHDVRRRRWHCLPQQRLPGTLLLEAAHELGAVQVREDQLLLEDEWRARKDRHRCGLLTDQLPYTVPAAGQACHEVVADHRLHRFQRRLTLDHGLRSHLPVAVPLHALEGVEIEILILERVHELVIQDGRRLIARGTLDNVEHLGARVVIADDLLLEEIDQERLQVHGRRDQTESHVENLQATELVLGALLANAAHEKVAHVFA